MSDELIRKSDALVAAHEADSLELQLHGASKIADRIAALPAVTLLTTFEEKMAQLPQERQDRIIANAAKLAALDDLARLGQEFDAAPDPAAIREAALREALTEIAKLGSEFQAGGSPTAVKVLNLAVDRIIALIPKGAAE